MSGARHQRKGDGLERALIALHRELGIQAERYPLSGSSRFLGSGHDVDLYVFGQEAAPFFVQVKACKNGGRSVQIERWLGKYEVLAVRRNHPDRIICLPWRSWAALLERVQR